MTEDEPAGRGDPSGEGADADGEDERPPPASATPGSEDDDESEAADTAAQDSPAETDPDSIGTETDADATASGPETASTQADSGSHGSVTDRGSPDRSPDAVDMERIETDAQGETTDEEDPTRGGTAIPSGPQVSVLPPERRVEAPIGSVMQANMAETGAEEDGVPEDVRKYQRFKKVDGAQYERVNEFLRERTYVTAREWAIARLCSDFRTETGIEMTKIGENLPHLVPFMTDTYTPQAVNQARSSFETKVRKSGATFLYGAMSDFFTADELDDIMYEVTEVAKFLLEVEGVDLSVDEELEGEERISSVMREVRAASDELRHEGTTCPNCGHEIGGGDHDH